MREEKVDSVMLLDKMKFYWMWVKERIIFKMELEFWLVFCFSDFNKVVCKWILEKEDDVLISILYVLNEKVCILLL